MMVDAVRLTGHILVFVLVLMAVYWLGMQSVDPEVRTVTQVDTVEVEADFDRDVALQPRTRIVFAPQTSVDTIEVAVPTEIRDTVFVTGPSPLTISRSAFSAPTVTMRRFDPRSGRGFDETFTVDPPNWRHSLYAEVATDEIGHVAARDWRSADIRVGVGAEVRYRRLASVASLTSNRAGEVRATVGLRYYFTKF